MTEKPYIDIIHQVFPKATKDEAEFLLWEKTGFPSFWCIPDDGNTPEECMLTQLKRYREELEADR